MDSLCIGSVLLQCISELLVSGTPDSPQAGVLSKGRFTRYDFVAYDKLTTGLRHELFRVNQTYNLLNGPKSCRRPVVSLSYATMSYRVNQL